MKPFSEYLKENREKRGLSQDELAEKLGFTSRAISKWETGAAKPQPQKRRAVLDFFNESGITEEQFIEYDVAAGVRKAEAMAKVTLSAVAELLAIAKGKPTQSILSDLQDLVNRELNDEEPGK